MSSHTNNYKNKQMNHENDTLVELDEYLKDDSNGQYLAQFIQKKLGAPRTKERVFDGFPMPEFNVNVKLTKCTETQAVSRNEIESEVPIKDLTNTKDNENNAALVSAMPVISKEAVVAAAVVLPVEKEAATVPTIEASTLATALAAAALAVPQDAAPPPTTVAVVVETAQETAPVVANSVPAAIEQSPIKSLEPTTEQQRVGLPTPNIPQPFETVAQNSPPREIMISPRSGLRRSGSCTDYLRRSAIKRRRRQLFPEFEESPIDFAPIVFSTPSLGMLPGATTKNAGPSHQYNHAASYQINKENAACNTSTSSCATNTNSHNLMVDHRRETELRCIIQSMLDQTVDKVLAHNRNNNDKNTPLAVTQTSVATEANHSRTYTIEKGSAPGQLVMMPVAEQTVEKTPAKQKLPRISVRKLSSISNQIPVKTETFLTIQSPIRVETADDHTLVPGTPSPKTKTQTLINISAAAGARGDVDIVIPETQEAVEKTHGQADCLNQSGTTSVVIRPMCCQAFYSPKGQIRQRSGVTTNDVETNTNTERVASSTGTESKFNIELANKKDILTNKSIQTTIVCNNENVNDLITDDESSDDIDDVVRNNSTAPLNLAPSGSVSTRMRLRAKEKNPKKGDYCVLNLRNRHHDAEGISRDNKKCNKIPPLNKAPNEPINGERFAIELTRMTYNEIVDLRKRNSLGKIFPICGRRSSTLGRNKIIANQQQLEEHIEREIQRRNLSSRQSSTSNKRVETTIVSLQEQPVPDEASMLPVPFGFEDTQRYSEVDSMARQSTRISRASSRSSRYRNTKSQIVELTETLKNYIDAKCKVRDRRESKRSISTKRYLYSKGDSFVAKSQSSSSDGKQNEIEIVRSPPPRTFKPVEVNSLVIVPPPPPLFQNENEAMPQFGSTNEDLGEKLCEIIVQEMDCNVHDKNVLPSSTHHHLSSRASKTQEQEIVMGMETSIADDNCEPMKSQTRLTRNSSKGQNEVSNQMETNNNNNINRDEDNVDLELPQNQTRVTRRSVSQIEDQCEMENIHADRSSNQPQNKSRLTRTLTKTQSDDKLDMAEDKNKKTSKVESKEKAIKRKAGPAGRNKSKIQKTKEYEMENNFKDTMEMESLRLLTPTPPNVTEEATVPKASVEPVSVQVELVAAHSTTAVSPTNNFIDDGEEASTSQAAAAQRSQTVALVINDDAVFKKPAQPAPKRARTKRKQQPAVVLDDEGNDTTIRRSKRGHVPLKNNWSFQQGNQSVSMFQYLYEKQMNRCMEQARKRRENETLKSRIGLSIQNAQPICSSTPVYATEFSELPNGKPSAAKPLCYGPHSIASSSAEISVDQFGSERIGTRTRTRTKQLTVITEIPAPAPAPAPAPSNPPKAVGANNKSKATKASKTKKNQKKTNKKDDAKRQENINKEEQVEKERQQAEEAEEEEGVGNEIACVENDASNSLESGQNLPSNQSKRSSDELISWLRNGVTGTQESSQQSCETFEGMQISSRGNLIFTDLEGIDYAFYDTEDHCSLGYMRFKPLQSRPLKRAKKYTLHFVVLSGEFVIGTSSLDSTRLEKRTLGPGDMAIINMGSRYSLENCLSDISIVMVIKK